MHTQDKIQIKQVDLLANNWGILKKTILDYRLGDGTWQTLTRETYDRGNGATILLYNHARHTVILTRQFRYPAYANQHHGMLIEACAGLLDQNQPEDAIRREAEEETGYRITHPQKIFELFMSPGSVTERLTFFVAEYDQSDQIHAGGGLESEGEMIEVLELDFDDALALIEQGEIVDGKTVILLQYAQLHGLLA